MRYAVADCRISAELERALLSYADKVLLLPPHPSLAPPVASHPDMLMWSHGSRIITFADYAQTAKDVFDALRGIGYEVLLTEKGPQKDYPYDVPLNCALVGKRVIANKNHVSELILKEGLQLLHTRQGYAKCATVTVSDNAVISADPSVCRVAEKNDIDVLSICGGHIRLDGYDTGFIGGCTGVTDSEVLFTGDLSAHPDGKKIAHFCEDHGKRALSLTKEPLYDYGTVFFMDSQC